MRRREFITLLGGTAAAWPLSAEAQQPRTVPVIGFLHSGSAGGYAAKLAAFRQGVSETGLLEGKDFAIEFHWAEGNYDRLRGMARDRVAHNVSVIVAAGGIASGPAAQAATAKIPIVFITGADPVATGLVKSLARPEANVTGVSFLTQSSNEPTRRHRASRRHSSRVAARRARSSRRCLWSGSFALRRLLPLRTS
jgi:putative ABC transport system substrate-binding protein